MKTRNERGPKCSPDNGFRARRRQQTLERKQTGCCCCCCCCYAATTVPRQLADLGPQTGAYIRSASPPRVPWRGGARPRSRLRCRSAASRGRRRPSDDVTRRISPPSLAGNARCRSRVGLPSPDLADAGQRVSKLRTFGWN